MAAIGKAKYAVCAAVNSSGATHRFILYIDLETGSGGNGLEASQIMPHHENIE
jgi:hypothetical protein